MPTRKEKLLVFLPLKKRHHRREREIINAISIEIRVKSHRRKDSGTICCKKTSDDANDNNSASA